MNTLLLSDLIINYHGECSKIIAEILKDIVDIQIKILKLVCCHFNELFCSYNPLMTFSDTFLGFFVRFKTPKFAYNGKTYLINVTNHSKTLSCD